MKRKQWYQSLLLSGALGLGGGAVAADVAPAAAGPAPNPPTAETPKPIPPSTAETADSAFKKLALGKAYVSRDDAKSLDGFERVFEAADADHDGRLSPEEFKKAWAAYTASDKANRG